MGDSNLPTLLRRGYIVPPDNMTETEIKTLKNTVSIEYILHFIEILLKDNPKRFEEGKNHYGRRVILLKSETGSGKSTVIPPKLYTTFFPQYSKNIVVTQPRILNAVDIPTSIVPFNKDLELGKNIGYTTGPFKRLPEDKGIIFATVGVLVQQLQNSLPEEFIKKYQFIIIDEVHERDEQLDLCLLLLKKFLQENYDQSGCPILILMSATLDPELFINYFDIPKKNYIQVIGSTFPINMHFPEYSVSDYIKYATLLTKQLHLSNLDELAPDSISRGINDIIIFVKDLGIGKKINDELHLFNSIIHSITSSKKSNLLSDQISKNLKEITEEMTSLLKKGGNVQKHYILPILLDTGSFTESGIDYKNLFSMMSMISMPIWKLQKENIKSDSELNAESDNTNVTINMESKPIEYITPSRRVIISTNLAETGVTIPTLKYCIDTGFQLSAEFYPDFGCQALITKNISHSSAIQRRGRVGRKAQGEFYPCYTEESFNMLAKTKVPNIVNNDITELILNLLIKEKNTEIIKEESIKKIKEHRKYRLFQMFQKFSNDWHTIKNNHKTKISEIDAIEMPSIQSLTYSIEKLHILGFIDNYYNISSIGFISSKFQFISMELRKFLLSGYYYKANLMDLITIATFVHISKFKVFGKTFNPDKFLTFDTKDDFITCLFIWEQINIIFSKGLNILKSWCLENGIIFDGIVKVIEIRDIILENMITIGLNPYFNKELNLVQIFKKSIKEGLLETQKIKNCIYEGFKYNILRHNKNTIYNSIIKSIPIKVKSTIIKKITEEQSSYPKYLICSGYTLTSKFNSAQYEFIADGYISVVDNFIQIDPDFHMQ
jgi:HrpA-like RNA helicase